MRALFVTTDLISVAIACAQEPGATTGWPFVGSDQAHTKYSAAEEITAANVGELEIVSIWEPNETPLEKYGTQPGPFQSTPNHGRRHRLPFHDVHASGGTRRRDGRGTLDVRSEGV